MADSQSIYHDIAAVEERYGRGPAQDELTGEESCLTEAVRHGDLLELDFNGTRRYWTMDEYGAPNHQEAYIRSLPVEIHRLPVEHDPYDEKDTWDGVESAWLQPVAFPHDTTPYGNTLPRLDTAQVQRWAERNGWEQSTAVPDDVLSVTTSVNEGSITLDYRIREADTKTFATMHGVFRRETGDDWHPAPENRGAYLAHVLTDLLTPHRDAQINGYVIRAAEQLPADIDADAYQDVLDDIRDLGQRFAAEYRDQHATKTWLQRKGQLQGLIRAKKAGNPVPDRFRSEGNLPSIAERSVADLEELLAVVDEYADEAYFAHSRDTAPVYEAFHPFFQFLVDDIARNDSRIRRRDWVDAFRDDDLLTALADERGGEAAHHVTAKWEEYVDMFERRLAETLDAKNRLQ